MAFAWCEFASHSVTHYVNTPTRVRSSSTASRIAEELLLEVTQIFSDIS